MRSAFSIRLSQYKGRKKRKQRERERESSENETERKRKRKTRDPKGERDVLTWKLELQRLDVEKVSRAHFNQRLF